MSERDPYGAAADAIERDVDRVAERLRSATEARLAQPVGSWPSRAAAGRALAQALADAAAALEAPQGPGRLLPDLPPLAVGDAVAVTGHDLVLALPARPPVVRPAAVTAALALLADLRRLL